MIATVNETAALLTKILIDWKNDTNYISYKKNLFCDFFSLQWVLFKSDNGHCVLIKMIKSFNCEHFILSVANYTDLRIKGYNVFIEFAEIPRLYKLLYFINI